MPPIDIATLKAARTGSVAISIFKALNFHEALTARLTEKIPEWFHNELASEGLTIFKDRSGQWYIEPLNE